MRPSAAESARALQAAAALEAEARILTLDIVRRHGVTVPLARLESVGDGRLTPLDRVIVGKLRELQKVVGRP